MRFEFVKGVIFKNEKIHPILATMDDDTKDAFFLHFYYHPTPVTFTRVDSSKVKRTAEEFISLLPADGKAPCRVLLLLETVFWWVWKESFGYSFR